MYKFPHRDRQAVSNISHYGIHVLLAAAARLCNSGWTSRSVERV